MTLVWGTNWPLFPLAVQEVSVWTFRSISLPISGIVLLAIAAFRGDSLRIERRYWLPVLSVCVAYLITWNIATPISASLIASGQSAVLGFSMPIWVALMSSPVLGEKLTARTLFATALVTASIVLLMVPSFEAYADAPLGVSLGLLAAIGWAVGTLIFKKYPVPVPPLVLVGWMMLITSLPIFVGTAWVAEGPWFMPSWQSIAVIAYIALIPMTIGNACWFSIVSLLPANLAALSTILVPVVAMISGAIVHGEPLGPLQIVAVACSATAMSLVLIRR